MDTVSQVNIKGMVCNRCIQTVRETLTSSEYQINGIFLGKVIFAQTLDANQRSQIRQLLAKLGFELLSDKNEQLLNDIKDTIAEWIELSGHGEKQIRLSEYLVQKFHKNYDSLSEFFSRFEGMTIEKYFIDKRIEKVKELLVYTDLSLTEIAFKTGFSSPHHLSNQFKKTTRLNPSELRQVRMYKVKLNNHHYSGTLQHRPEIL